MISSQDCLSVLTCKSRWAEPLLLRDCSRSLCVNCRFWQEKNILPMPFEEFRLTWESLQLHCACSEINSRPLSHGLKSGGPSISHLRSAQDIISSLVPLALPQWGCSRAGFIFTQPCPAQPCAWWANLPCVLSNGLGNGMEGQQVWEWYQLSEQGFYIEGFGQAGKYRLNLSKT